MECVPACRTCTGLCKTVPGTGTLSGGDASNLSPMLPDDAIWLRCKHYTTPAEQLLYKRYKAKGTRKLYCSQCGDWKPKVVAKVKPVESIAPVGTLELTDEVIPF